MDEIYNLKIVVGTILDDLIFRDNTIRYSTDISCGINGIEIDFAYHVIYNEKELSFISELSSLLFNNRLLPKTLLRVSLFHNGKFKKKLFFNLT